MFLIPPQQLAEITTDREHDRRENEERLAAQDSRYAKSKTKYREEKANWEEDRRLTEADLAEISHQYAELNARYNEEKRGTEELRRLGVSLSLHGPHIPCIWTFLIFS